MSIAPIILAATQNSPDTRGDVGLGLSILGFILVLAMGLAYSVGKARANRQRPRCPNCGGEKRGNFCPACGTPFNS